MKDLLIKDIQLQWRQGFWLVYFIVSVIYVLILLNIPAEKRMMVSLIMILSDTSMLGVIFIGALILLEKQQNVIHSLFVTPLKPGQYILSKSISLSLIAVSMSILIYLPVWHASGYTVIVFLTILITGWIFALLGLGIAAGVGSINAYFGTLIGVSMLILIPVIPYLLLDQYPAFLWLPYIASLDIMLGALEPIPIRRIILDMLILLTWAWIAYRYCRSRVNKHLVFE